MLRDKSLIPLSRQHQHALALCVRIDRAAPINEGDLPAWQSEISQIFQTEMVGHFATEEEIIFPEARKFEELLPLIDELLSEHADLRARFAKATGEKISGNDMTSIAQRLSTHIRKEERQLFERMQRLLGPGELATMGKKVEQALDAAAQACILPTDATRLRSAK